MKNTSNDGTARLESLAFLASLNKCTSITAELELIDDILDIAFSPSMPSLLRTQIVRSILNSNQDLVYFCVDSDEIVPFPSITKVAKATGKRRSSKSTNAKILP